MSKFETLINGTKYILNVDRVCYYSKFFEIYFKNKGNFKEDYDIEIVDSIGYLVRDVVIKDVISYLNEGKEISYLIGNDDITRLYEIYITGKFLDAPCVLFHVRKVIRDNIEKLIRKEVIRYISGDQRTVIEKIISNGFMKKIKDNYKDAIKANLLNSQVEEYFIHIFETTINSIEEGNYPIISPKFMVVIRNTLLYICLVDTDVWYEIMKIDIEIYRVLSESIL